MLWHGCNIAINIFHSHQVSVRIFIFSPFIIRLQMSDLNAFESYERVREGVCVKCESQEKKTKALCIFLHFYKMCH